MHACAAKNESRACTCTYAHAHLHVGAQVYMYTCVHVRAILRMHACAARSKRRKFRKCRKSIHVRMCTCTQVCRCAGTHVYMHACNIAYEHRCMLARLGMSAGQVHAHMHMYTGVHVRAILRMHACAARSKRGKSRKSWTLRISWTLLGQPSQVREAQDGADVGKHSVCSKGVNQTQSTRSTIDTKGYVKTLGIIGPCKCRKTQGKHSV